MEEKPQNEVEKSEDVKRFEEAIGGEADDIQKITFRYYYDKKAEGWCVFSDEYPNHGGQGKTKKEALQSWTELFAEVLAIEDEHSYQVK